MGMVPAGDAFQKMVSETAQVALAVVVGGDACGGGAADLGEGRSAVENPTQYVEEIAHGAGLIEKTGAYVFDQLGNPSNRRGQDQLLASHRFHQHNGNAFAQAGQHHQAGAPVIVGEVVPWDVAEQTNLSLELQGLDLALQGRPFRPFAGNPATEVATLTAKRGARLDQKPVILHAIQSSNREQKKRLLIRCWRRLGRGWNAIDTQALDKDF